MTVHHHHQEHRADEPASSHYHEFLGDASQVPAGWEAPVDEDAAAVPPMEAADVEWEDIDLGEGAKLEAGEMLPIEDILEPLEVVEEGAEDLLNTGQVDALAEGSSYIEDVVSGEGSDGMAGGRLSAATDCAAA